MPDVTETAVAQLLPEFAGAGAQRVAGEVLADLAMTLEGDLVRPVFIGRARALSSTRIRIDFNRAVTVSSALTSVDSYILTALGGAVTPTLLAVDPPQSTTSVTHVELITSEMTAGVANYQLLASSEIRDVFDQPLASDPVTFSGVGDAPTVRLVRAESATRARVLFSEPIADVGDFRNLSAYAFSPSTGTLAVEGVVEYDVDGVLLATAAQEEGHLYTFVLDGDIFDHAGNKMARPYEAPMLGFISKPAADPLLRLQIYNFLYEGMRQKDTELGGGFVYRLLQGPQVMWAEIIERIFSLTKLWSLVECPDELVPNIGPMVGWSKELAHITEALDVSALRRLFSVSSIFWRQRGPEDSTEDLLRLATGARLYIENWFDQRALLDEVAVGDGANVLADVDQSTYTIRIVDDGSLDRALVQSLARLTRPTNERVETLYLLFLDRFQTTGDLTQWDDSEAPNATAGGGQLTMGNSGDEQILVAAPAMSGDWTSYFVTWRMRCDSGARFEFYRTGPDDAYFVGLDDATLRLGKRVAGAVTQLGSFVASELEYGASLSSMVWWKISVAITPNTPGSSTNNIRVYIEGVHVIEALDSEHSQGTIAIGVAGSEYVEVEKVEIYPLPSPRDFIDING